MKYKIFSFLKAIAWLLIGTFIGCLLIVILLSGPIIFSHPNLTKRVSDVLNNEFISFLSLALICGAASDYVLSVSFTFVEKIIIGGFSLFWFISILIIFNQVAEVKHGIETGFTIAIVWFAIPYCLFAKAAIFYKEEKCHRKL